MTTVDTQAPPVLIYSLSDLGTASGRILRHVRGGAVVRVDEFQVRDVAALVIPPSLAADVLAFLGIDPDALPEPGTVRDSL